MNNADGRSLPNFAANVMTRYYSALTALPCLPELARPELGFAPGGAPGLSWPELDSDLAHFFSVSSMSLHELENHTGRRLLLLNLMHNPGTRTTKTFASLSIVARAIKHIRDTGEKVCLFSATSGNKGTALRDAVHRAIDSGLVASDQLRVVIVVPAVSRDKLRAGGISDDSELQRVNPVVLADVDVPDGVKGLTREVALALGAELRQQGWLLWHTLGVDNYRVADAARAFFEAEFMPISVDSPPRVHAHAVSSAWGLLGYHLGHRALTSANKVTLPVPASHPGFLLVQHLATPDMVLSQAHGNFDRSAMPRYELDPDGKTWRQDNNPLFPSATEDPAESIDPTFYTTAPTTVQEVNVIIKHHGGGGIVVSKKECLERYSVIRAMTADCGIELPADPARLREWSVVMALTGVLQA